MNKAAKKNPAAPLLAVAAIGLCWVGVVLWRSLGGDPAQHESSTEPEFAPTTENSSPVSEPLAPVGAVFDLPEQSGTDSWPTYHGGPGLTGLVNGSLPDKLEVLWRYQATDSVYQSPVSCGGRIYFATDDGTITALSLSGEKVWSNRLVRGIKKNGAERLERFDAPIACFESTVLAGASSGKLFAFDAATGEQRWVYELDGPMLGTINLIRMEGTVNVLAIAQDDGSLHSIDLATGALVWESESTDRCDGSPSVQGDRIVFGSCAAALHIFSAKDGHLLRNIEFDGDSQVAGGVALAGDFAFSGSNSGRVFHTDLSTGEILWTNDDSEDEVFTTPAVTTDRVIFTSYDGTVHAVDRGTGQNLWTYETPGVPSSPVIVGDRVVFGSDGVLYLLNLATGEKVWSYEISDEISSPAIVNGTIFVGSEEGTVTAFGAPGS